MLKFSRFILPIALGLILGIVVLWFSSQSPKAQPVVVATNQALAQPNPTATVKPIPTPTMEPIVIIKPIPPPGIGSEYLALGDSIAYGTGAPNPNQQGYAGVFYTDYLKRLQPDLAVYRNLAVPGETSASFISLAKGKSQLQRALEEIDLATKAGKKVSPISLTIGGNDMLEARGKTNAEREAILSRFEANLIKILDQLRAAAKEADLIVTTYYNPYAFNTGGQDSETTWVRRFNDSLKKRAEERQARVADFFEPVVGQEPQLTWIGLGDVHPSLTGHLALAQALWKATGYDTKAPSLVLTYSPLPADNKVGINNRLIFKLETSDEWAANIVKDTAAVQTAMGAGMIMSVTATLNAGKPKMMTAVPSRYSKNDPTIQEYTYIADTTSLTVGFHKLRFEVSDAAGNVGHIEVNFEVIQ